MYTAATIYSPTWTNSKHQILFLYQKLLPEENVFATMVVMDSRWMDRVQSQEFIFFEPNGRPIDIFFCYNCSFFYSRAWWRRLPGIMCVWTRAGVFIPLFVRLCKAVLNVGTRIDVDLRCPDRYTISSRGGCLLHSHVCACHPDAKPRLTALQLHIHTLVHLSIFYVAHFCFMISVHYSTLIERS